MRVQIRRPYVLDAIRNSSAPATSFGTRGGGRAPQFAACAPHSSLGVVHVRRHKVLVKADDRCGVVEEWMAVQHFSSVPEGQRQHHRTFFSVSRRCRGLSFTPPFSGRWRPLQPRAERVRRRPPAHRYTQPPSFRHAGRVTHNVPLTMHLHHLTGAFSPAPLLFPLPAAEITCSLRLADSTDDVTMAAKHLGAHHPGQLHAGASGRSGGGGDADGRVSHVASLQPPTKRCQPGGDVRGAHSAEPRHRRFSGVLRGVRHVGGGGGRQAGTAQRQQCVGVTVPPRRPPPVPVVAACSRSRVAGSDRVGQWPARSVSSRRSVHHRTRPQSAPYSTREQIRQNPPRRHRTDPETRPAPPDRIAAAARIWCTCERPGQSAGTSRPAAPSNGIAPTRQ
eukprot:ctg_3592.g716